MGAQAARQTLWRAVRTPLLLGALGALCAAAATAGPFVPTRDDTVLARVQPRAGSDRALRDLLRREPQRLDVALRVAREAIERARRTGDPRELGVAQAALAPWWSQPDPPPGVRLLRGTLRQSWHEFDAALADFDALHADAAAPAGVRAQAELSRAGVLQVLGRYAQARGGCEALLQQSTALGESVRVAAQACLAELDSLAGRRAESEQAFQRLADEGTQAGWLALLRAQAAERAGDPRAEAWYRLALSSGQDDVYTRAAFADWLLAQSRAQEVPALLDGREEADALLLRLAIAQRRLRHPQASDSLRRLDERFAAARLRGDSLHRREEALAALDLHDDPARALALAQAQWRQQKEPADARLLVRAAHASGRPEAAEAVWQFARASGLRDIALEHSGAPS
jgi:hypothetical protein